MAQDNDSQVCHPVITFRVNLETLNRHSFVQPNRTGTAGNETVSEADNMKASRNVYIPGLTGNIEGIGPGGFLHHGDTFTVKGMKAQYLKQTYVKGNPDDILQIVS